MGRGEPPIILVHGWTCDHTYFAPQAEHFRGDHRVISVDLRGHGESDKPQLDYTMAQFADDIAWLCEQLRVRKPVVIGHSMGGVIAFELAARHPDLPAAVVGVDSPIIPSQEVRNAQLAPERRCWKGASDDRADRAGGVAFAALTYAQENEGARPGVNTVVRSSIVVCAASWLHGWCVVVPSRVTLGCDQRIGGVRTGRLDGG